MPADEYHADARAGKYLSSHLLGDFRACPLLYHRKMSGAIKPQDSAAYQIGRAVHTLILEGRRRFDEEFTISDGPINPKTGEPFGRATKAYREWAAAQRLPIVSGEEFGFMTKLQQSVWLHPQAGELLRDGRAEGTIRVNYNGEPCQIRMDYFNPACGIIDLKTCDNLTYFESDARKFGYANQLSFYREVFRIASGGEAPDVWIIAIEKREPYRCGVWKLTTELLDQAKTANERAMELLRECRIQNTWPTGYEETRIMDI